MNILVDIGHPAHVHLFREPIRLWLDGGHRVVVTARNIPVALGLLKAAELPVRIVSRQRHGVVGAAVELIEHTVRLLPLLRKDCVDVVVSVGGTFSVYAGWLARCSRVVLTDTEIATKANRVTFPFATAVVTPEAFPYDLGPRQIRYRGIHELAYLHPTTFQPDPDVLRRYSLAVGEPFSVVRLIRWGAVHDAGLQAAGDREKREVIAALRSRGRVMLVPEESTPPAFAELHLEIRPEDFHHLLYYANSCVTEGATTASEACLLGTPSLYWSPLRPACTALMEQYDLLRMVSPGSDVVGPLAELLARAEQPGECASRARRFIADHVEVAPLLADLVLDIASS